MKDLLKNFTKLFTKKNILTIPNAMSLFRLLLIPVIIALYMNGEYYWAIAVIAVSWLSDIADGWVARHFNQVSELGKMLDPLADKLTQLAMIFCLCTRYPMMWIMFGLFLVRDITQIVLGSMVLAKNDEVNSANWFGKVSTGSVYIVTITLILWVNIPSWLAAALIVISTLLIMLSLIAYVIFYLRKLRKQDK